MEQGILHYWPQIVAFVGIVGMLFVMREKIRSLEEKVKELFRLWNDR